MIHAIRFHETGGLRFSSGKRLTSARQGRVKPVSGTRRSASTMSTPTCAQAHTRPPCRAASARRLLAWSRRLVRWLPVGVDEAAATPLGFDRKAARARFASTALPARCVRWGVRCVCGQGRWPALETSSNSIAQPAQRAPGKLLKTGKTLPNINDAKAFDELGTRAPAVSGALGSMLLQRGCGYENSV
jgi:hypothetical protein